MEKGLESEISKTVKNQASLLFTEPPSPFYRKYHVPCYHFGRHLPRPFSNEGSDYETEIKISWSVKAFLSEKE